VRTANNNGFVVVAHSQVCPNYLYVDADNGRARMERLAFLGRRGGRVLARISAATTTTPSLTEKGVAARMGRSRLTGGPKNDDRSPGRNAWAVS
jgi:hypothetical protein